MSASSNMPIPFVGGEEEDGLTDSHHIYCWGRGARKALKRQYNKRARRYARSRLIEEQMDA